MEEILETDYEWIEVESYYESGSGLHGIIHIRPLPGQEPYKWNYRVECSKKMVDPHLYPVGTKFRIWAKVSNMHGTPFVYTNYTWRFDVLEKGNAG